MQEKLARKIVDGLKAAGIDFLTYLPESRLSQILPLMQREPAMTVVPVASEAEGVTIAAGAVLGGKQAACYLESSGLYVASYSLLTIGKQLGVPILLIVGYLGGFGDQRNSFLYATVGQKTIPLLDGLGIESIVIENDYGLQTRLKDAVRTMNALRNPVALLFAGEFTV
jgi:sulfopyruvate decarboxylase TPP-binding subunit